MPVLLPALRLGATAALLGLATSARAGDPLGEAWVPVARAIEVPGVGPAEGRRVDDGGVWRRVVVEPWAIAALRSVTEVRDYVPDPSALRGAPPGGSRRGAPPPGYHGPDDVTAAVDAWAARLVRGGRRTAGRSSLGRPIDAVWLGQAPGSGAPVVRLLGGHHGDEAIAVEVALALGERLVDGDGADPEVTALLDRATVWVVPLVNPDGLGAGTRENAAGVDLNRNYDWAWSPASVRPGATPFSEPETRAVRALALIDPPGVSVSLHAGAANLGWPWNHTVDGPPDAALLGDLADAYAAACDAPDFWVTQGATWYVTHGDTNDWAYGRHGTLDYTLEVAVDRAPAARDTVIGWHEDALLALLAVEPTVSGRVVDAETGEPVQATITSASGRPVTASPVTGAFHRYDDAEVLTVSAPGYTEAEIAVASGPVDVALAPVGLGGGRMVPAVVSASDGRVVLALGAPDGPITLSQPGYDPVMVEVDRGAVALEPGLAPGPWTVTLADGRAWPRALLVEQRGEVAVDGHTVDAVTETATLRAAPLEPGVVAWAMWGERRPLRPLPVLDEGPDVVVFDVAGVPRDQGPVDLLVVSGSAVLAVDDLWATAGSARPDGLRGGSCSASGTAGARWGPTGLGALAAWLWVARKRRSW